MKKKSSRKKWLVATAAFALLAIGAGTFAWFQSQDNVTNHFEGEAAGNDVEIVELFVPKPWEPGGEVTKRVGVANIGKYDSIIRVSLKETLAKLADSQAKYGDDAAILNGKTTSDIYVVPIDTAATAGFTENTKVNASKLTVTGGDYAGEYTLKVFEKEVEDTKDGKLYNYISYWDNGKTGADAKQYFAKTSSFTRAADGTLTPQTQQFKYIDLAKATPTVRDWLNPVYTPTITIDGTGKATINGAADDKIKLNFVNLSANGAKDTWTYNATDGYFYYIGIVAPQAQTKTLLSSVTLDGSADNSYSKLSYDLDVNARSIQATKEAVNSTDWLSGTNTTIQTALEGLF